MVHLMGQPAFAIDDFLSPAGQDQGVEIWLLDKVPRFNFFVCLLLWARPLPLALSPLVIGS